jgi:hypothetical protein
MLFHNSPASKVSRSTGKSRAPHWSTPSVTHRSRSVSSSAPLSPPGAPLWPTRSQTESRFLPWRVWGSTACRDVDCGTPLIVELSRGLARGMFPLSPSFNIQFIDFYANCAVGKSSLSFPSRLTLKRLSPPTHLAIVLFCLVLSLCPVLSRSECAPACFASLPNIFFFFFLCPSTPFFIALDDSLSS